MKCFLLFPSSCSVVSWLGRRGTWASLLSMIANTSGWVFTTWASCASSVLQCLFWRGTSPMSSSASWLWWSSFVAPSRFVWSSFPRSVSVWQAQVNNSALPGIRVLNYHHIHTQHFTVLEPKKCSINSCVSPFFSVCIFNSECCCDLHLHRCF